MEPAIRLDNISKHFKVPIRQNGLLGSARNLITRKHRLVRAVDQVSFEIQHGELVGYLGPNGAGKSTTIKMMTGLLVPTNGSISVNQTLPWRDRTRLVRTIGAVFGQRTTLWWDIPVRDSLQLLRHIYNIPAERFRKNFSEFIELLELSDFLDIPVRSLSLGQRMRADLGAALLHDPEILFLDEPTIGLDVVAKERIRQFILHINQERGTTVILTTHDISDVEKLCHRVLIIDQGHLLYNGALHALHDQFAGDRELLVEFAENYTGVDLDGASIISQNENRVIYSFPRNGITASALIKNLSSRFRIRDLSVQEPEIETTIRRIYEYRLLDSDHALES